MEGCCFYVPADMDDESVDRGAVSGLIMQKQNNYTYIKEVPHVAGPCGQIDREEGWNNLFSKAIFKYTLELPHQIPDRALSW